MTQEIERISELIERVAQAISTKTFATVVYDKSDCRDWKEMPERTKNIYREAARAAIRAMREPTDSMIDNGQDARLDGGSYYDIWRAMIDSALEENPDV